jgi:hypothetical protein
VRLPVKHPPKQGQLLVQNQTGGFPPQKYLAADFLVDLVPFGNLVNRLPFDFIEK